MSNLNSRLREKYFTTPNLLHHNCNKIPKSDWSSTALISALIGQYASCLNWTVRAITHALAKKEILEFLVFWFKKEPHISQILLKLCLISNRTLFRPILSVIILVIKQIVPPLRGRPILSITELDSTQSCCNYLLRSSQCRKWHHTTCSAHFFKFRQWNPLPEVRVPRNLVKL